MKKYVFIVMVILMAVFCFCSCHQDKKKVTKQEFNETKNLEQLKGLFDLQLGVTTVKDLKKISCLDKRDKAYGLEENYSGGYYDIEQQVPRSVGYDKQFELEKELEKRVRRRDKRAKQYYFSKCKNEYIEANSVSLWFLDDILVGIHVHHPTYSSSNLEELLPNFMEKYGKGIGYKETKTVERWNKDRKMYEFDINISNQRIWEYGNIRVEYSSYSYFGGMKYVLRDKYEEFDKLMKEAIKSEYEKFNNTKKEGAKSSI
ncbi:hypothetical protein EZS27_025804 [termite gut metagenome]|uniref:Uncharacterized protein n=1 Tax=termite gut metagenome TaxID=433724 RepID=A0A5J4QSU8_9ZZZZ